MKYEFLRLFDTAELLLIRLLVFIRAVDTCARLEER